MVLLTLTPAASVAIKQFQALRSNRNPGEEDAVRDRLSTLEIGSPINHEDLIQVSSYLRTHNHDGDKNTHTWRMDTMLKGASVYQPPPPARPEPRLRHEEEQRQYERMINPPPQQETFGQRFPRAAYTFDPATSIGQGPDAREVDEVTFADVNRQMALIINVLVSVIACSVAIWIAARSWTVPQRLALSMSGSGLVAIAEVAIYMGYIRRIKESKDMEKKIVENKRVVESWVLDGSLGSKKSEASRGVRYRKGKYR